MRTKNSSMRTPAADAEGTRAAGSRRAGSARGSRGGARIRTSIASVSSKNVVGVARSRLRRRGAPPARSSASSPPGSEPSREMSSDETAAAMAAAQARWEGQVRQGRFRSIEPSEVSSMMRDGWVLLDVRPEEECSIASVDGSVHVPLFRVDDSFDPGSLIKQMSAFGMGGWWLGTKHMVPNKGFMGDVMEKLYARRAAAGGDEATTDPRETEKVIVACQKGLRSLAACEQLANAGFKELAWVNGGYDMSRKGDLPVDDGKDIRYAGIGGVSSLLGWTEVQQEENKGLGGGVQNVLKVIAALVVLDGLVLLFEQAQYAGVV